MLTFWSMNLTKSYSTECFSGKYVLYLAIAISTSGYLNANIILDVRASKKKSFLLNFHIILVVHASNNLAFMLYMLV
jgi:hypothetical protein